MIKSYANALTTQLSPHFNVREFRCKCGKSHDTPIDTTLIDKLEQLHSALKCSKIIVNSGYRCTSHDISVGGYGTGQHTKGTAVDIVCYDKDGKIISSKIVSCAAQDIGFGGIANIDSTYTATHVDVRTGSKWWSDETAKDGKAKSLYTDFYVQYKLTRKDVYGEELKRTKDVTLTIDGVTYSGTLTEK